jgi:hypothetical protein
MVSEKMIFMGISHKVFREWSLDDPLPTKMAATAELNLT